MPAQVVQYMFKMFDFKHIPASLVLREVMKLNLQVVIEESHAFTCK